MQSYLTSKYPPHSGAWWGVCIRVLPDPRLWEVDCFCLSLSLSLSPSLASSSMASVLCLCLSLFLSLFLSPALSQGAKYPLVKMLTALSQGVNSNIVVGTDKLLGQTSVLLYRLVSTHHTVVLGGEFASECSLTPGYMGGGLLLPLSIPLPLSFSGFFLHGISPLPLPFSISLSFPLSCP